MKASTAWPAGGARRGRLLPPTLLALLCLGLPHPAIAATNPAEVRIALDAAAVKSAGIATAPIVADPSFLTAEFPGTVVVPPGQLTVVATPSGGLIESSAVSPNEAVAEGAPLFRIHSSEIIDYQRQYLTALSDAEMNEDRLQRAQKLLEIKATAERDVRAIENDARKATLTLDQSAQVLSLMGFSDARIKELRANRRMQAVLTITAPTAGTVVTLSAKPGERVQSAAPLATIADLDPLWVEIAMPATRLRALAIGSEVTIPDQEVSGRIIRLGSMVDARTQTATAVAEIDPRHGAVRPGQAVEVGVRLAQDDGPRWKVPSSAVMRSHDSAWVFVETAGGFVARGVEVLGEGAEGTSVRGPLAASDRVVVHGTVALLPELERNAK